MRGRIKLIFIFLFSFFIITECVSYAEKPCYVASASIKELLVRANDLLAKGKIDEAIREYELAIKKEPGSSDAHFGLAKAYGAKDKRDLYEAELKEVLKIDPSHTDARYLLASWYFVGGRNDGALSEAKTLLQLDPKNVKYHMFAVMVYEAMKRYSEAIEELKINLKLDPGNTSRYLLSLAAMYKKNGQHDEAKRELKRVIEGYPKSFEARLARPMLEKYSKIEEKRDEKKTEGFNP